MRKYLLVLLSTMLGSGLFAADVGQSFTFPSHHPQAEACAQCLKMVESDFSWWSSLPAKQRQKIIWKLLPDPQNRYLFNRYSPSEKYKDDLISRLPIQVRHKLPTHKACNCICALLSVKKLIEKYSKFEFRLKGAEPGLQLPDVVPTSIFDPQTHVRALSRVVGGIFGLAAVVIAENLPDQIVHSVIADPKVCHTLSKLTESHEIACSGRRRELMTASRRTNKFKVLEIESKQISLGKIRPYHNTEIGPGSKTCLRKEAIINYLRYKLGDRWATSWDRVLSSDMINEIPIMKSKNRIQVGHMANNDDYITLDGVGRFLAIILMCAEVNLDPDSVTIEVESFLLEERDWIAMNRIADKYFDPISKEPIEEISGTYSFYYAIGEGLSELPQFLQKKIH